MASAAEQLFLAGAGVVAGAAGSAGGITSLVSYPALLAVGIPPLPANVTQAVAFVACLPGSTLGSRRELAGCGPFIRRWSPVAIGGGIVGLVLLLSVSTHVFGHVVPFLLLAASAALLGQRPAGAWLDRHPHQRGRLVLPIGLSLVSVYNGYFGAGSGVMVLSVLLLAADPDLPRSNALKNVLIGLADAVVAVGFVLFGPVRWWAALPLALGLLLGSTVGPSVTRIVPDGILRVSVALLGIGLAVRLLIAPV